MPANSLPLLFAKRRGSRGPPAAIRAVRADRVSTPETVVGRSHRMRRNNFSHSGGKGSVREEVLITSRWQRGDKRKRRGGVEQEWRWNDGDDVNAENEVQRNERWHLEDKTKVSWGFLCVKKKKLCGLVGSRLGLKLFSSLRLSSPTRTTTSPSRFIAAGDVTCYWCSPPASHASHWPQWPDTHQPAGGEDFPNVALVTASTKIL